MLRWGGGGGELNPQVHSVQQLIPNFIEVSGRLEEWRLKNLFLTYNTRRQCIWRQGRQKFCWGVNVSSWRHKHWDYLADDENAPSWNISKQLNVFSSVTILQFNHLRTWKDFTCTWLIV